MTQLIDKTDPRYFTVTSDELYDRHQYEFVYSNGQYLIFDTWEEVRSEWFNTPPHFKSHVNVIDRPKKKKSSGGGFR